MVPSGAARFLVHGERLAARLELSGAQMTDERPDVEIVAEGERVGALRGEAPVAVILRGRWLPRRAPRGTGGRVVRRAGRASVSLVRIGDAVVALRRRGYRHVRVLPWEVRRPLAISTGRRRGLPAGAVVAGYREPPARSAWDDAVARAAAVGAELGHADPTVKSGMLLAVGGRGVLRLAVGPAAHRLVADDAAIATVLRSPASAMLGHLVPATLGRGEVGIFDWTVQQRMPGEPARPPLSPPLSRETLAVLRALAGSPSGAPPDLRAWAADVARFAGPLAGAVEDIGDRAASTLTARAPCLGHGDFWHGNLLVVGNDLRGIIDWDGAGASWPGLDVLQLVLGVRRAATRPRAWGTAFVDHLLPWADGRGDDLADEYFRTSGDAPAGAERLALVMAYWLRRTSYQLLHYEDRVLDEGWRAAAIGSVASAVIGKLRAGQPL